jgi:hypothetical protein
LSQADTLIDEVPSWLDAYMVRGLILDELAKKDPEYLEKTIEHWRTLHTWLAELKTVPPDDYEIVWHLASSLSQQAEKTGDDTARQEALDRLQATMNSNKNLNSPDMVARYQKLIEQLRSRRP